jgi:TetR/AcrR family transcriptional regulator, transcriptional repressor for nem operon
MHSPMGSAALSDTATRILNVAEQLVQTQGFNGFSYADISVELGIRKASLHHHFPTKAELGKQMIARYQTNFLAALAAIDARVDGPKEKLEAYAQIYRDVLNGKRMCLCGMLAAEFETLPRAMKAGVQSFFAANEAWVVAVLDDGRKRGVFGFEDSAPAVAHFVISSLEGAMLVGRSYGPASRFEAVARQLVAGLVVTRKKGASSRSASSSSPREKKLTF